MCQWTVGKAVQGTKLCGSESVMLLFRRSQEWFRLRDGN